LAQIAANSFVKISKAFALLDILLQTGGLVSLQLGPNRCKPPAT
jgi:hypothetical protein